MVSSLPCVFARVHSYFGSRGNVFSQSVLTAAAAAAAAALMQIANPDMGGRGRPLLTGSLVPPFLLLQFSPPPAQTHLAPHVQIIQ